MYDVSQWSSHPGGAVLCTHAGQDATSVFAGFHGSSAYETMTQFYIGDCDELLTKDTDFEREIRALGPEMKRRGLYDARFVRAGAWGTRTGPLWLHTPSARLDGKHHNHVVLLLPRYSLLSLLYYTYKFFSTTAIGLLGIFIAYNWRNMWGAVAAGLVIGTFWQQCGWMAHDFCHHQVFKNRRYNDYMTMVIGSYLGFSLGWWKNKHNTHHAIPNVHESATDAHDGDPDIDTLPFLAWSPKLLRKVMGGTLYWGSQSSDDVAAKKAREAAAVDGVVVAGNHVDISAVKVRRPAALRCLVVIVLRACASIISPAVASGGVPHWRHRALSPLRRESPVFVCATHRPRLIGSSWYFDSLAASHCPIICCFATLQLRYEVLERLALIVHYVWYAGMMITLMTPASAAVFFAVSQVGGYYLYCGPHMVFGCMLLACTISCGLGAPSHSLLCLECTLPSLLRRLLAHLYIALLSLTRRCCADVLWPAYRYRVRRGPQRHARVRRGQEAGFRRARGEDSGSSSTYRQ